MGILKANSKNKPKYKHLGLQMIKEHIDYLSLYCVANEFTKSMIVKNLVNDFILSKRKLYPDKVLIDEIVSNLKPQYQRAKKSNDSTYIDNLVIELVKKGVSDSDISEIIRKLKDEKND